MITTAKPILDEVSLVLLKEPTSDYSTARLTAFKSALDKFLTEYKWKWSILTQDFTLTSPTKSYDMSALPTYNPSWGMDEIWVGEVLVLPIDYTERFDTFSDLRYYMSRDNMTLYFTETPDDEVNAGYYGGQSVVPSSESTSLDIKISPSAQHALALLTQHFVHLGKRQRLDARNALLDYQQEVNNLRPQEGSKKGRHAHKKFQNVMTATSFRRTYTS